MTKGLVIRMKRVLICDDAAFMRLSIMKMLKGNGYDVAGEASNGDEAIEQYKILNPDIVLMDITMPGLDGISAVKAIKEYDPNAIIIREAVTVTKDIISICFFDFIEFLTNK